MPSRAVLVALGIDASAKPEPFAADAIEAISVAVVGTPAGVDAVPIADGVLVPAGPVKSGATVPVDGTAKAPVVPLAVEKAIEIVPDGSLVAAESAVIPDGKGTLEPDVIPSGSGGVIEGA
jgi:hypothetical protein